MNTNDSMLGTMIPEVTAPASPPNEVEDEEEKTFEQHAHLIRIPTVEAMERAIMVLGEVPMPYHGFSDSRLLVENGHIEALRREAIPFEHLA